MADDSFTDDEELDKDFHRVKSSRLVREFRPREGIMKRFLAKVENVSEDVPTIQVKRTTNIFISYCWHSRKEAVHEMAKFLTEQDDFKVWIDMQNISGYAYESMARGIDEADVVLCFFSQEYAESGNCRREIEYAANKNKDILPIRVERGYRPDGWLLFIFKSQMRIDYCEGDNFQDTASKICDYLHSTLSTAGGNGGVTTNNNSHTNNNKRQTSAHHKKSSVNFKTAGVPFFSKSKYFSRQEDETRILMQMKNIAETPEDGCLVISGDGGVGKTTTISRMLLDESNHAFFVNDCNVNRAIWINCFDWREHFDEKAFVDKTVNLAKELEESNNGNTSPFNSLQGITSYYKKKNLRLAFILDDMFNFRLIQFFLEKQAEPPICFVVTRDAQTIIETNFGMVQKVERLEEMNDDGIRTMLKTTYKLGSFLNEEQLLRLAKLCCGLPLIASLIAARITNCEGKSEVKSEFKILVSPQYKISELKTQNRSFKTVSNLFTFSLDQMDASLRTLYYAFLLFNPAEPVSIFDLGILWGFDLDEENRCGLRGVCRAFEKKSLVRRVKKLVIDEEDDIKKDTTVLLDDTTEDRFLLHQMLYESALVKAKKDYGLEGNNDQECLAQVRVRIISGNMGDEHDESGLGVLLSALKYQRRLLLERIIAKLDANALAEFCLRKSPQTNGKTFLHYLYDYSWQQTSKAKDLVGIFGYFYASTMGQVLAVNPSYGLIKKMFGKFVEFGGDDLLWRVVNEPQTGNRYSSTLISIIDGMKDGHQIMGRIPLLTRVNCWIGIYEEIKWEERLLNEDTKTAPIVLVSFDGDLAKITGFCEEEFSINEKVRNEAVCVAARRGHLEIVRFLLKKWPDTVKAADNEGQLPIMLASRNGHLDVVQYLWEKWPESLEETDEKRRNAILVAARNGHLECVKFLFEKNPDTAKQMDIESFCAFTGAANDGRLEIVKYLAENNPALLRVTRRQMDSTALTCAAGFGKLAVVKYLYEKYDTEEHGKALSMASLTGNVEVVNYLLVNDPECAKIIEKSLNATALMVAAMNGQLDCVEALYGKCDDFVETGGGKVTAVMMAATGGHADVVKWLFFKNPDTAKLTAPDGESAMSIAEKMGHVEITQFLKDNA